MERRLFCEISPLAYQLSTWKEIGKRALQDLVSREKFASVQADSLLPVTVKSHSSLIRRKLGGTGQLLQENKAVNLALAAPHVDKILIRPGETFSFWRLVGNCTARKGYREGLTIRNGVPSSGIGGGMCQFTNLIHWMVLHSPLTVTEHHHHNGVDLFPDFGRKVPFGSGTSILYNYRDYRFRNDTAQPFQLVIWLDEQFFNGELRTTAPLQESFHIREEESWFTREPDGVYRHNKLFRRVCLKSTGKILSDELLLENYAKVVYDPALIAPECFR